MSVQPNLRPPRRKFLSAAFLAAIQGSLLPRISLGAFEEDSGVFKGESLDGWMTLEGQAVRSGWEAKGGEIFLKRGGLRAGPIITRKEFGDFELSFDWKIAKGGNSGIKDRVRNYGDRTLGCEDQIYDPNGQKIDSKNK